MYVLIIINVLMVTLAMPINEKDAEIIKELQTNDETGYTFSFETSNGISHTETGKMKVENGSRFITKTGFYSYVDPNNLLYVVQYVADENGFHSTTKTQQLGEFDDRIGSKLLLSLSG